MTAVRTTCAYCGVGCGVLATATGDGLDIAGDEAHPANFGRLCSKGGALGKTVGLGGRLLSPRIGARTAPWREATGLVARRFRETIQRHGPDSVAFYVSGQLLTEDYYAANKLMKGFIGSSNIDTNSRLCMASAVAAHKLAFGADLVPGCYEDLELADLVVFAGHNAAWTHPVLHRRMEAQRRRGQRHVVIDTRRTDTAEGADVFLQVNPQTDIRLWNGLLADLVQRGAIDRAFIDRSVHGYAEVVDALSADDQSPAAVARDCGLAVHDLEAFYALFARTPRTVTLFSQGSNQSAQGVAKGLAILNTHLATGRIGKPGAAPFSITGQPNAMGGRETGGMANTLAAHMDFSPLDCERVARFWGSPAIARAPGLKAVDMFDAVRDGTIRAIWVMATNPAVSMPDAGRVREALQACPFVVVSDMMETDTTRYADVALPALAWGEKDGTVTNSERCISRQRAVLPAPGEARADWRIIADVATEMGYGDAFSWKTPGQVFGEWARLTAYENQDRLLDLSGLIGLNTAAYDGLEPVQWPVRRRGEGQARLFADGRFQTPDGRARITPVRQAPAEALDSRFPLSLNTGRVRDQWHTMTRTGLAPDLCRHAPEPYVEVNPADAETQGLRNGSLTRVQTERGEAVVRAKITDAVRAGSVFMPMHWSDAFAPSGVVNPLVSPRRDPVSGQPEFKHTPARVRAYRETWNGFFLDRAAWSTPRGMELIWRRVPDTHCQRHLIAGRGDETERAGLTRALAAGATGEPLSYEDPHGGVSRQAWIRGGRLERVLFLSTKGRLPNTDWLADLFALDDLGAEDRLSLLAGVPSKGHAERGPVVCACKNVRAGTIAAAIAAGALTVEAVGAMTQAGVTCGSCQSDIRRMLPVVLEETRHAA